MCIRTETKRKSEKKVVIYLQFQFIQPVRHIDYSVPKALHLKKKLIQNLYPEVYASY